MLRNYIKIAVRNLMRRKFITLINILGLSIGMVFCILAFLYLNHELSYDSFHTNGDRIYRVVTDINEEGWGRLPYPLGPLLADNIPEIEQIYKAETNWLRIIRYTSILTLFVSCLDLLGLTALSITNRTKEIGIRKILGASVSGIILMITKNHFFWLLLSNLIAWPLAWYAMNRWLQDFAYRIDITIWPFLFSGFLAFIIALMTVSWQAIRAATANPVESLRYE